MNKNLHRRKIYGKYISQYFDCTKICKNIKDIEKITQSYNYIIAGSDQIWNNELTGGNDEIYYLNFKIPPTISHPSNSLTDILSKFCNNFLYNSLLSFILFFPKLAAYAIFFALVLKFKSENY